MTPAIGSDVRGLVDAFGSGGASVGGTGQWRLIFNLTAWRTHEGVESGKIRCELPVDQKALKELMGKVKPYAVVNTHIVGYSSQGAAQVSGVQVFSGEDADLARIREELQIPVRINTAEFGELELDRRLGSYNGKAKWCGSEVSLSLSCKTLTDPSAALVVAVSLFQSRDKWNSLVKEFASERLLHLKNDNWLEDDEAELSRDEFMSRMSLSTISVDESGAFTFWHDDGELFGGHTIMVSGDLAEGLKDAHIAG